MYIINDDYFNVNEENLWNILIKWAKYQSNLIENVNNTEHEETDDDVEDNKYDNNENISVAVCFNYVFFFCFV